MSAEEFTCPACHNKARISHRIDEPMEEDDTLVMKCNTCDFTWVVEVPKPKVPTGVFC